MSQSRSCILAYHSLDNSGSVISISPEIFRAQMAYLAENEARVVPLSSVSRAEGAIALTFDDGFRNFLDEAFPVLQQYHFPATVFVISDYCGRSNEWPSQPGTPWIPKLPLMSWSEVKEVARAGISIGCHSATHPRMSRLTKAEMEEEFHSSRAAIEDHIESAADTFAYPYGDCTQAARSMVARYFQSACGTRLAFLSSSSDRFNLPRMDMYYLRHQFWFRGLTTAYGCSYISVRRFLRGVRERCDGTGRAR